LIVNWAGLRVGKEAETMINILCSLLGMEIPAVQPIA
jgi:hypothetical protein